MVNPESFRRRSKDPEEAAREVRMLIMSYASTYASAYDIARTSLFKDTVWCLPQMSYERQVISKPNGVVREWDLNPDHLSGLQRYKLKYHSDPTRSHTPIALQFWK